MKILYITNVWTGLESIIFEGSEDAKGMPAFIKPLKELCERGHDIDMYLIHNYDMFPDLNIKASWAKGINFLDSKKYERGFVGRIKNYISMNGTLRNILKNKKYDFIYAHGTAAGLGYKTIIKSKIPYGHRLYGTWMNYNINQFGYYQAIFRHYIEYRVFKDKKDFLLVTDDASRGDLAHEKIVQGKQPYQFEHWINGADPMVQKQTAPLGIAVQDEKYLVYVARISRWKAQHRAIELMKSLDDNDIKLNLYIVGQVYEQDYYEELKALTTKYGLTDRVIFTGGLNKGEIAYLLNDCIAGLSFYDNANRGNVFYEYLAAGAAVISLNDGSLDDFIINGENGFLLDDISEGVQVIKKLLSSEKEAERIKSNARRTFDEKMKTWDERVQMEIDLINKYVGNKR